MKSKILFFLLANLLTHLSVAQKIGGGELNPGIYTDQESLKRFQDLRFGLSIHWGPNSVAGKEIGWSRGTDTPKETYDLFYQSFNPVKFSAKEWIDMVRDFGMKYICITTKHHDGFAMWPSDYSEYDLAATPFKKDILKELSDECQKQGIVFGTYYSTLDWYHPDYQPYGHGGPGKAFATYADTPNQSRYWIYIKNQVKELITKYNTQIIQFDGDWDSTWTHEVGSDMYLYVKKLNDKVLVNNRTDKGRYSAPRFPNKSPWNATIFAGDFEERERITENFKEGKSQILGRSPYPWQAWVTVDKSQWSWKPNPSLLSYQEIVIDFLKTIGDNGNYLINIGPRADGSFEPQIVENMKKVGAWVNSHADIIFGSRGGEFSEEDRYTSITKDGKTYLFVFDQKATRIVLPTQQKQMVSVKGESGKTVSFKQKEGKTEIKLSQTPSGFVSVYTIEFAK